MRPSHDSNSLALLAALLTAALVCTSCRHGLPNEAVFIVERSTTQHAPNGRVYTSLGANVSMRAGDPEIGLMHILILPPAGQELVESHAKLDEGVPQVLRFEWQFSSGTAARLTNSYDPQTHVVTVSGHHYLLSKGNLFVAQVGDRGSVEFRQLGRTAFWCVQAQEALATFKRELPNNERLHSIHE